MKNPYRGIVHLVLVVVLFSGVSQAAPPSIAKDRVPVYLLEARASGMVIYLDRPFATSSDLHAWVGQPGTLAQVRIQEIERRDRTRHFIRLEDGTHFMVNFDDPKGTGHVKQSGEGTNFEIYQGIEVSDDSLGHFKIDTQDPSRATEVSDGLDLSGTEEIESLVAGVPMEKPEQEELPFPVNGASATQVRGVFQFAAARSRYVVVLESPVPTSGDLKVLMGTKNEMYEIPIRSYVTREYGSAIEIEFQDGLRMMLFRSEDEIGPSRMLYDGRRRNLVFLKSGLDFLRFHLGLDTSGWTLSDKMKAESVCDESFR